VSVDVNAVQHLQPNRVLSMTCSDLSEMHQEYIVSQWPVAMQQAPAVYLHLSSSAHTACTEHC
jgi:hypothetical protein